MFSSLNKLFITLVSDPIFCSNVNNISDYTDHNLFDKINKNESTISNKKKET